jgi:uncharacterized ferritin-like protein (DUF455 family)
MMRELQRHAVDSIKRHAIELSLASPRAQRKILTEYLWTEEAAETTALDRVALAPGAPAWLGKLVAAQAADEARHVALLRARLAQLGVTAMRPPPKLARAKLWWLERAVAPYLSAFAAGPAVVVLACAAQLEATGVRMFGRHLAVLEERDPDGATTAMLRSILSDERRHARSCAAATERLIQPSERALLAELREQIARVDRAFGVTLSVGFWIGVAAARIGGAS